jgi:hypothetical protein
MAAKRTKTDERAAPRNAGNGRDAELDALRPKLAARLTIGLVDRLGGRGIHTLGDLGAAGGIQKATRNLRDVKVGPHLTDELDAHLRLSTLPTTPAVNKRLIAKGFTSLDRIADAPRDEFVAAMKGRVGGPEKAAALHATASAQSQFLSNVLTGELVNGRNGTAGTARAIDVVAPELCDCDCRDATSPVAYLADLLDYTIKHLRSVVFASGLRGEYFADTSFGANSLERVDTTVDFDWGGGSPDASLPADAFSVRWTGTVKPPSTDGYTFSVAADDGVRGVRLWVDGQLVVDQSSWGWGGTPSTPLERYGSLYLEGGQRYDLKLEYVESGANAKVRLLWSSSSEAKQVVPQSALGAGVRTDPITLTLLEDRYHQPFRGLSERCEYMEEPIRQVRIACEVLRASLPTAIAGNEVTSYVEVVYRFLLGQIGTTYDELSRAVASQDKRVRSALSSRLGIFEKTSSGGNDHLDDLFLDVTSATDMTEAALEERFGYRATTTPPLDPSTQGAVVGWRLRALQRTWRDEDWPQSPPPGARPLIDPDLVGALDMQDSKPTVTFPRTPVRPMDFLEDRRMWVQQKLLDVRQAFESPLAGFPSLITDRFTDTNGVVRTLLLGIGTSIANFESLAQQRAAGDDVSTPIQQLELDLEGFDFLVWAWQTSQTPGGSLSGADIDTVCSILVQRLKRTMFPTWRGEESAKGITLSQRFFRLRTADDNDFPWQPAPFRGSQADRRVWVQKLRARIEREQAVVDSIAEAISEAEEAYLVELRTSLLTMLFAPGAMTRTRLDALTDRLQLDLQESACQMTTRVAQAIDTVQSVLFGARNGLLEGHDLALDDVARFDQAWRWIGSYSTWRAAIRIFLHPESALRPTLRRKRTAAFDELVDTLRAKGTITPGDAESAAAKYSSYFRDVCSLSFTTLARVSAPPTPGEDPAAAPLIYLIVARGGFTGHLYFCTQDLRPDWWLQGGFERSLWNPIPGLDATAQVDNVFTYRSSTGQSAVCMYVTTGTADKRTMSFLTFDGSWWSGPSQNEPPLLLTSARYQDGVLPASPDLASAGGTGWQLQQGDRIVAVDVDGDGRKELVLAAGQTALADGTRRFGIVRERGGALVLDREARLPGEWDLPAGEPVIVRTTLVQTPFRRREQLLVVRATAPRDVALLGETTGAQPQVALIRTSSNSSIPGTGGAAAWSVDTGATFVAADVDGDGFSETVAVQIVSSSEHRVTVLDLRETGFAVRSTQVIQAWDDFYDQPENDTWGQMVAMRQGSAAEALVVLRFLTRQTVLTLRWKAQTGQLQETGVPGDVVLMLPGSPQPIGFDESETSGFVPPALVWVPSANDVLRPARLGLRPTGDGGELLAVTTTGTQTAVFLVSATEVRMIWRSKTSIPAGGPIAQDWTRQAADSIAAADLDGDGAQELLFVAPGADRFAIAGRTATAGIGTRGVLGRVVQDATARSEGGWTLAPGSRYVVGDLDGDGCEEVVVFAGGRLGVLRGLPPMRGPTDLGVRDSYGPSGVTAFDVVTAVSPRWSPDRPAAIRRAYELNQGLSGLYHDDPDVPYLDEAYTFVPTEFALRLDAAGSYTVALDWFRSIYDYERRVDERKIAYGLVINGDVDYTFVRGADWLADPLNPHAVAATRRDTYTRYTILAVVRCLLDYADSEFTKATSESLPRARELYLKALELLGAPELQERAGACSDILGRLRIQIGSDEERQVWHQIIQVLGGITTREELAAAAARVEKIMASKGEALHRLARAYAAAEKAAAASKTEKRDLASILEHDAAARDAASVAMLAEPQITDATELIAPRNGFDGNGGSVGTIAGWWETQWVPAPSPSFCIRPNPMIDALRSHAEVNLRKLRNCRSISGLELHVAPYAEDTAATAGGGDGLPAPPANVFQPLPYRYSTLIERTKQLVELARQLEQSMLAAIQNYDHALYEELKARHDMSLARSQLRLHDLQLVSAADGVRASELQRDRASISVGHYQGLIDAGLSDNENISIGFLYAAALLHAGSAAASFYGAASIEGVASSGSTAIASGLSSLASTASTMSQVSSTYASYERRAQDWRLQRDLSQQDVQIGNQQIRLAQDQAQIASQERAIASLELDHSQEILDFLTTRQVGTAELYEWMSGVLEQIYRFFLQQATSMAKLAEAQLAFERQELPAAFIRDDYWEAVPSGSSTSPTAPDTHGLTGSERLLADVTELDQYAFTTDRRKLQLTKTISVGQLDPFAFQRFRETGILPFATPQVLFDRDFPGHYLRLVKGVRTSVIALIPPTQGIHATLSTTGPSRVVIGHDTFNTVVVQRPPESVALTAPLNSTGLFELNAQPEMLGPFEGIGVDATWELSLPKAANQFDYSAIADVLLTIDYTALNSYDYRDPVLKQLDGRLLADRPFLFRNQFADAWYDLHNPEEIDDPTKQMVVRFRTARDDFPPNLDNLTIEHVGLYLARAAGDTTEVDIQSLTFRQNATTVTSSTITSSRGLVSTRRANAGSLAPVIGLEPVGEWELSLNYGNAAKDAAIRKRFKDDLITDILFVISYAGETPPWPS